MHPRLIACLLPTIALAFAAAVWCVKAGWGYIVGLAVYSFGGAFALVALTGAAALAEGRREAAPRLPRLGHLMLATPVAVAVMRGRSGRLPL